MLLKGMTAMITGGAAGIGRSTALCFGEAGAEVIIADIDEQASARVTGEITLKGGKACYVHVDMADVSSIRTAVSSSINQKGKLDILVNNAGIARRGHVLDQSEADWDAIMAVNAKGLFFCLQTAATHMADRKQGSIVNISSIGGKGSRGSSSPAYALAKAGVIGLTRMAAIELGRHNINVNAVCPGATADTGVYDGLMKQDETTMLALKSAAVMNRINSAADVANAILFLASPLAASITGQSLNVDNGTIWD